MSLLGRPEIEFELPDLTGQIVGITGARGFIGQRVREVVLEAGGRYVMLDYPDGDILDRHRLKDQLSPCHAIIHLAAHKYAPRGETHPVDVADVNIDGTANVVKAARPGARVVFSSTCKAADPCTVYGASKLIGERIVLNAGGTVVRLVNVLDSSGSVLRIWREIPETDPIPVTPCSRYWMSLDEAARGLVAALALQPGRYAPAGIRRENIVGLAQRVYPTRRLESIPLRRGDRPVERIAGEYEDALPAGPFLRVVDLWERAPESVVA